ncbi:methyl-accepting chemotaxis protein [Bacillus sp. CGMCC 1.16607]|uniref:methyl-accepting chemotaxis protein n=1 Tax=Bacillus sp. CGMCC 1.16607 TaxID=3351842 RepID=UPI00362503F5
MQVQSNTIVDLTKSLEYSGYTISQTATLVEKLHSDAIQTDEVASSGFSLVSRLKDEIQFSYQDMIQANEQMTNLSKLIQDTSSFVTAIQEIANQTNLLALNASIEAARAGESGKGFAVVAEEVRKLADNSSKTASQISDNLKSVFIGTEETMEQISNTSRKTTENLQLAIETQESFSKISESFVKLRSDISKYESLTKEFSHSSKTMEVSVNEFSSIIEQASATLQELSISVGLQTSEHEKLFQAITSAHDSIESLLELQK